MKKMKNLQFEGPSTKYDHFMKVCTDKNGKNEKKKSTVNLYDNPYRTCIRVIMEIFNE